jgi:hypothetical protein
VFGVSQCGHRKRAMAASSLPLRAGMVLWVMHRRSGKDRGRRLSYSQRRSVGRGRLCLPAIREKVGSEATSESLIGLDRRDRAPPYAIRVVWHRMQRQRSSTSGTSPRPPSISACRPHRACGLPSRRAAGRETGCPASLHSRNPQMALCRDRGVPASPQRASVE